MKTLPTSSALYSTIIYYPAMSKFQLEHIPIGTHAAVAVQLYIYMTIKTTNLNYIPKQMCIPKHDKERVLIYLSVSQSVVEKLLLTPVVSVVSLPATPVSFSLSA